MTLDHDWLLQNLERVRTGLVEDGTAIGSAIASAANRKFIDVHIRRYAWHPALFDFAVFVILTKIFYAVLGKLPL